MRVIHACTTRSIATEFTIVRALKHVRSSAGMSVADIALAAVAAREAEEMHVRYYRMHRDRHARDLHCNSTLYEYANCVQERRDIDSDEDEDQDWLNHLHIAPASISAASTSLATSTGRWISPLTLGGIDIHEKYDVGDEQFVRIAGSNRWDLADPIFQCESPNWWWGSMDHLPQPPSDSSLQRDRAQVQFTGQAGRRARPREKSGARPQQETDRKSGVV